MISFKKNIEDSMGIKLKTQLIASFMVITFIILTVSFLLLYKGIFDIVQTRNEKDTINQFRQVEYSIQAFNSEVEKISRVILVDTSVQKFLQHEYSTLLDKIDALNALKRKLNEIIENYEYLDSIYIFLENDEAIGVTKSKYDYIEKMDESYPIFSTDIFRNTKERFSSLLWQGGYKSWDFEISDYGMGENKNLLTASKALKSYSQTGQAATLIININEKLFSSMYNQIAETSGNSVYLINNQGLIISQNDKALFGSYCSWFSEVEENASTGSLVIKKASVANRIVFYRLKKYDWILINESPADEVVRDILSLNTLVLFIYIISLIVAFSISLYWIKRITQPLNELVTVMKKLEDGRLGMVLDKIPRNELGMLGRQFNKMSLSISELLEKNKLMEQEKRTIEMEVLQAQINPHFLFNTLNSIKWMAVAVNAKNIVESLNSLGKIIQPIFKNKSIMCTIREELEYVDNYITIMNYRYGKGISTIFDIPEEYREYRILKFILQPMIENSFEHGLNNHIGYSEIFIKMEVHQQNILLMVKDNGDGISRNKLESIDHELSLPTGIDGTNQDGIGLLNVNRRIKLHFGKDYGIKVESAEGVGTKVLLLMPLSKNS